MPLCLPAWHLNVALSSRCMCLDPLMQGVNEFAALGCPRRSCCTSRLDVQPSFCGDDCKPSDEWEPPTNWCLWYAQQQCTVVWLSLKHRQDPQQQSRKLLQLLLHRWLHVLSKNTSCLMMRLCTASLCPVKVATSVCCSQGCLSPAINSCI